MPRSKAGENVKILSFFVAWIRKGIAGQVSN